MHNLVKPFYKNILEAEKFRDKNKIIEYKNSTQKQNY